MDDKAAFGFYPQLKAKRTTQDPEAAKNVPIDLLRGRIAGTVGLPGDIEQLARDLAMLAGAPESQSFLPTTERVLPRIPLGSDTPVSRAASGLGSLTANPMDVVRAGKAATKAAKSAKPAVGQALEEYMFKQGLALPATVYHGSPHKFEKFDASKIGTGEGAQAYGHGLYLAESPGVAQDYADVLSVPSITFAKKPETDLEKEVAKYILGEAKVAQTGYRQVHADQAWKKVADPGLDRINGNKRYGRPPMNEAELEKMKAAQSLGRPKIESTGNFYKVDLPDEYIAKMLDWDAPMTGQSEFYKQLAKEKGLPYRGNTPNGGMDIYHSLVDQLGSPEAATKFLRDQGIPGIRYLDGGSRGTGQGTSNFVVFPGEENALTILERNQQPIKKESTRLVDNPDAMMMEVEDKKLATGGMIGKAVKSAIAARELEKQAILRAEAATKSAAKQALMPQYNEAVKGQTQKQNPPSFEQWKAAKEAEKLQSDVLPAAERDANLSKFLSTSKEKRRLYHATPADFKEFQGKGFDPTISGNATWLTANKEKQPAAHNISSRTEVYREGTNVMPVYIQAERPLVLDNELMEDWARAAYANDSPEFPFLLAPEWLKKVKEDGYDSIFHPRSGEIIMLEPNKIKSAIGNRGTYDIEDADITKAEGGAVYNTDPDMSDGGQMIQGAPFKHGGDVNLDAMYMAVNDAKFRRK